MKLSVAMIVKNEAGVLRRSLECASKLGDEVIVLDTGSTDGTREVACSFPKVKFFESARFQPGTLIEDFNFGAARNESLRECQGEWVCFLDADDIIDDESIGIVRRSCGPQRVIYAWEIVSGSISFMQSRLFPLGTFFDETHSCHEYIEPKGLSVVPLRGVRINHCPKEKYIASADRNLLLLERDYNERRMRDPRTLFYLGNARREKYLWHRAVLAYDEYLERSRWREERMFARSYKAVCMKMLGDIDGAVRELKLAVAEDPRFAEPLCGLGDYERQRGNLRDARLWYAEALKREFPKGAVLFVNPVFYDKYPRDRLAELGCEIA